MGRVRAGLSYANVMATIAVFIALGGGAWAVSTAAKDSVVTKSIRDGAVTAKKLDAAAVTGKKLDRAAVKGAKIKPGSVKGRHVDLDSLGIDPGISGDQVVLRRNDVTVPALPAGEASGPLEAACESTEVALGGGGYSEKVGAVLATSIPSPSPSGPSGWQAIFFNATAAPITDLELITIAVCAPKS